MTWAESGRCSRGVLSGALKDFFRTFWHFFPNFPGLFLPFLGILGMRDETIGRDLHFAPVDGPRFFWEKYFWSRYYWNFGFSRIDWFFELFMASSAKTTFLTSFGPIWSLYFRSQYLSLSRFCQFYVIFSAAVLKKNLLERRLVMCAGWVWEGAMWPYLNPTLRA